MKTFMALLAVLFVGFLIVRSEFILYRLQAERQQAQFRYTVGIIQTGIESTPTPTPHSRDTMHVTQRTGRQGPGAIKQILDLLSPKK